MKRTERRHLKEDELTKLARQAREAVDARGREVTALVSAAIVIGVAVLGYITWRDHVQSRAHAMLAAAVAVDDARVAPPPAPGVNNPPPPPGSYPTEQARAEAALVKYRTAADAYPTTDAGIFARYQEAATLMTLGRPADAVKSYQEVIARGGSDIYAQMARLGLAQAQARAGQYDQAITAFKDLAQRKEGPLPIDAILMQLGRTQMDAGKPADAKLTFTRIVDEYPESAYSAEARQALESLKKT